MFKSLFAGQPYPVVVHDQGCTIVYANSPAIDAFQIPALEEKPGCYLKSVCNERASEKKYCANIMRMLSATKVFEPRPGRTLFRISIPVGLDTRQGGVINIFKEAETPEGSGSPLGNDICEPILIEDLLEDRAVIGAPIKPLTKKEREVLGWLMKGKLSSEISAVMGISENTVNYHMKNIFGKLGAENRTHAASLAYKREIDRRHLMLREMHHRIKNNFAILGSLIAMRRKKSSSNETLEALAWMEVHLKSFASFHRLLMDGERMVSMNRFLPEVIAGIASQAESYGNITIVSKFDPLTIHMDIALPVAQIINELTINAIRHAFRDEMQGRIEVRLYRAAAGGGLELLVADNGIGLPEGFDMNSIVSTMGMSIVRSLVAQVGGECKVSSAEGARFTVSIPCDVAPELSN